MRPRRRPLWIVPLICAAGLFAAADDAAGAEGDLAHDALFGPNTSFPYFAEASALRSPSEDSALAANAAMLAQCSLLCYVDDRPFVENAFARARFDRLQYFDRKGTFALLAESEADLLLVFRGTESSDTADIRTDSQFLMSDYRGLGPAHSGFIHALAEVSDEIDAAIATRQAVKTKRIWVAGHSLGGALATLWGLAHPGEIEGVFTFGAPRLAGKRIAAGLGSKLPLYRFVNDNDAIPRLPPPSRYRHIGSTYFLNCDGALLVDPPELKKLQQRFRGHRNFFGTLVRDHWTQSDFQTIPSDYIVDHSPVRYAQTLIALANKPPLSNSQ